jgi:hypothetical protein
MQSGMAMEAIAEETGASSKGLAADVEKVSGVGAGEAGEGTGGSHVLEAGTAAAVLQWEETKKLQGRIEVLK